VTKKQSTAATGKKRGPYAGRADKCQVKGHDHNPRDCPGQGKVTCIRCGKSLLDHSVMQQCGAPVDYDRMKEYIENREGKRIWRD